VKGLFRTLSILGVAAVLVLPLGTGDALRYIRHQGERAGRADREALTPPRACVIGLSAALLALSRREERPSVSCSVAGPMWNEGLV